MSDRKYRQRGYQDDGPRERRGSRAPRERREGPRGRGLGTPTATVFRCARCGREVEQGTEVQLEACCPGCGSALHSCTNCRHFDPSAPRECRQPVVEAIAGKAKANRCELFAARLTTEFARESADSANPANDAKSAFDALFDL